MRPDPNAEDFFAAEEEDNKAQRGTRQIAGTYNELEIQGCLTGAFISENEWKLIY